MIFQDARKMVMQNDLDLLCGRWDFWMRICFDKDLEITKGLQGRMPWWSPFAYLLLGARQ